MFFIKGHDVTSPDLKKMVFCGVPGGSSEIEIAVKGGGEKNRGGAPCLPEEDETPRGKKICGGDLQRSRKAPASPRRSEREANPLFPGGLKEFSPPERPGEACGAAVQGCATVICLQAVLLALKLEGGFFQAPRHGAAEKAAPAGISFVLFESFVSEKDVLTFAVTIRHREGKKPPPVIHAGKGKSTSGYSVAIHIFSRGGDAEELGGRQGNLHMATPLSVCRVYVDGAVRCR